MPLLLCPDRDEQLVRLTEGRVPLFSHDLVPDYLRTKPEPEVEHKMMQLEHKATNLSFETIQVYCADSINKSFGIKKISGITVLLSSVFLVLIVIIIYIIVISV